MTNEEIHANQMKFILAIRLAKIKKKEKIFIIGKHLPEQVL